jgi:uncharacterized protein (DUF1697 family)
LESELLKTVTVYVALLRGINVGGHNQLKMIDLRQACSDMGLERVQTYIQSGNILFASDEVETPLSQRLEQRIRERFGISTAVILRTAGELGQVIRARPFSPQSLMKAQASAEGESLYVSFLKQTPSPQLHEQLSACVSTDEDYRIIDRNVYLLFARSVRNSKLAHQLQKSAESMTVRNWKTINKLYSLAQAMES